MFGLGNDGDKYKKQLGGIIGSDLIQCTSDYIAIFRGVVPKSKENDDAYRLELFLCCLAFNYIIVDLQVHDNYSAADRTVIMNAASYHLQQSILTLADHDTDAADSMVDRFQVYLDYLTEFTAQIVPAPDKTPKGTLVWEFGKYLSKEFKLKPEVVPLVATHFIEEREALLRAVGLGNTLSE